MPGYLQRLELDRALEAPAERAQADMNEMEDGPLKQILVELFCGGHVSASGVQKLAHAALLSGLQSPDVASLAALGAVGEQPGNNSRDLLRLLNRGNNLPEPFRVRVPCIDPATQEYCMEDAFVMLPHQLLASLPAYDNSSAVLRADMARAFWEQVCAARDPRLYGHPMTSTSAWKTNTCQHIYMEMAWNS